MVQKQLLKFESAGLLMSQLKGKTRVFSFSPRFPFKNEMNQLLVKPLEFVPLEEKEKYFVSRRRPRRTGKPL
jgi:hypothetical protein